MEIDKVESKNKDENTENIDSITSSHLETPCTDLEIISTNTNTGSDFNKNIGTPENLENLTETINPTSSEKFSSLISSTNSVESSNFNNQENLNRIDNSNTSNNYNSDYSDSDSDSHSNLDSGSNLSAESDSDSDSDSSSNSNSNSNSNDSENENEPKLKYSRIRIDIPNLFNSEPLSAVICDANFFIFGTHMGTIYITDTSFKIKRSFKPHSDSILSLSLSEDSSYLASASRDGNVIITLLSSNYESTAFNFGRPIHAVSLDPNYTYSKSFVSGGMAGNLVLSYKSWLRNRTDVSLVSADSPINQISWKKNIILWTNDEGIHFYSIKSKSSLSTIPLPENSPRPDLYTPRLHWINPTKIIFAWAHYIWFLSLNIDGTTNNNSDNDNKNNNNNNDNNLNQRFCNVDCLLVMKDAIISGISPFNDENMLVLSYLSSDSKFLQPQLRIISQKTGEEISADVLDMKGFQKLRPNDYHLSYFPGNGSMNDKKYLILSALDGIIAKERTLLDKYNWLCNHAKYEEAWRISKGYVDEKSRSITGANWIKAQIDQNKWENAAEAVSIVMDIPKMDDSSSVFSHSFDEDISILETGWLYWIKIFTHHNHLDKIVDKIPYESINFNKDLYTSVLKSLLKNSIQNENILQNVITNWPPRIYDYKSIFNLIEDELTKYDSSILKSVLANGYLKTGHASLALPYIISLNNPDPLELITKYHILSSSIDYLPKIYLLYTSKDELDKLQNLTKACDTDEFIGNRDVISKLVNKIKQETAKVTQMLISGRDEVSPLKVIKSLKSENLDLFIFFYLNDLSIEDPYLCKDYGDFLVPLYAKYDHSDLLKFLKIPTNNYNLADAAGICEKYHYIPELIFLLGQMGKNKQALSLIIEELGDLDQAIEFAKSADDSELWTYIIDHSLDNPVYFRKLLESVGKTSKLDPISLLRNASSSIPIGTIRDGLYNALNNYKNNLDVAEKASFIVYRAAERYSTQLKQNRTKAIRFEVKTNSKKSHNPSYNSSASSFPTLTITSNNSSINIQPNQTIIKFISRGLFIENDLVRNEDLFPNINKNIITGQFHTVGSKLDHVAHLKRVLSVCKSLEHVENDI